MSADENYLDNPLRDIMKDENTRFQYFINMSKAFAALCGAQVYLITQTPDEPGLIGIHDDSIFILHELPTMVDRPFKLPESIPQEVQKLSTVSSCQNFPAGICGLN